MWLRGQIGDKYSQNIGKNPKEKWLQNRRTFYFTTIYNYLFIVVYRYLSRLLSNTEFTKYVFQQIVRSDSPCDLS
jgi:hypothetical protein